ncbi:MAG: zinc transport system substrate-binding protein, partial [Candidatus Krumholzibacteriia bacterium]
FAARYGVVQVAVEDAGHEPGAQHLVKIIEQAQAAKASVIIVQPQFSQRSAAAVAQSCSAEVLVLDPLATDYENNLLHIAQMLANAWEVER